MDRQSALTLMIIFFIVFFMLSYYGAMLTVFSSLVFSTFVSLILLNIFYPPNQVANDDADFTLVIYAVLQLLGILFIAFYVAYNTLIDVRCK